MNLRDLKSNTLRRLAVECDEEYVAWFKTSNGEEFVKVNNMNVKKPISLQALWRIAFSKGSSAILRRVDTLKENT